MAKTLERIFEQKIQQMPLEEYELDMNQKGRKRPPKKQKSNFLRSLIILNSRLVSQWMRFNFIYLLYCLAL